MTGASALRLRSATEVTETLAPDSVAERSRSTEDVPPVLTRTVFYLGVEPPSGFLTADGAAGKREAARSLRGRMLKQEIFAEDGEYENLSGFQNPKGLIKNITYLVTEKFYTVKVLQDRYNNKHGVFFAEETETRTRQSERQAEDFRFQQQLILKTDEFGNVLREASVGYPRGFNPEGEFVVNPDFEPEQTQMLCVVSEKQYINNTAETATFYRIGLPFADKSFEVSGLNLVAEQNTFVTAELLNTVFDTVPANTAKKLLAKSTVYYADETGTSPAALGETAAQALPLATAAAAFDTETINEIVNNSGITVLKDGEILENLLTDTGKYAFSPPENLWYKISEKITYKAEGFWLPEYTYDVFENEPTEIAYDAYNLLPVTVTDALSNVITAENDYRVLKPFKITDPNGNTQEVIFDVRGMVIATAVSGKNGEGDTLANPGTQLEYDLFNFVNHGKPNYVKTTVRIFHVDQVPEGFETQADDVMVSYTYTGGFGQQIMLKVQAEPTPNPLGGGLEPTPNPPGGSSEPPLRGQGVERWVGTGRTILNNKAKPVKQYEPYFSDTPDYEPEEGFAGVTPVIHYDPLVRPVRTDMPDGTFTKVEFTPWLVRKFDANDTVLESDWLKSIFADGIIPADEPADPTERSAWLAAKHANTPQTVHLDTLGREFLTVDDNGTLGKYTVRNTLDIVGNITKVTDAKLREMTFHVYDMLKRPLRTKNIDSGTRMMLADAADKPLRTSDLQGFENLAGLAGNLQSFTYDELQRPVDVILTTDSDRTVQKTVYGTNPDLNNIGKPYKILDQSGIQTFTDYDFKGNPLQTLKEFCEDSENTIDWSEATINTLIKSFSNSQIFDALNRPVLQTKPDGSIVKYEFNEAGLLETITRAEYGQVSTCPYVTDINYNARGQRTEIYYGNNSMTRYFYDANNFRLTRLLSTRNTGQEKLQDINYTYDPVGNITEIVDKVQQTIYFNNTVVEPKGKYKYDALYRLIMATGREHNTLGMPMNEDFQNNLTLQEDGSNMRNYEQTFVYDELGNIREMKNGNIWTRDYFYNFADNNYLLKHDENGVNSYEYDAHGNMVKMPHLQSLSWDFKGNLKEVTLDLAGNKAFYNYDSTGNRVRKVVVKGNITETRYYVGDYEYFEKTINGVVDITRETLHINDDKQKVALIEGDIIRYQMTNHLGSSSLELDENADIISYEEYHPFGTTSYRSGRSESEVSLKRYKYVFKELDNETGLYYYGARYYAAWIGRFISVDPKAEKFPWQSSYCYAGNEPVKHIDYKGMFKLDPKTLALIKEKYPQVYKYLVETDINKSGNILDLAKSDRVINALIDNTIFSNLGKFDKNSGMQSYNSEIFKLTREKITEAFTFGNGPEIRLKENPGSEESIFNGEATGFNSNDDGTNYSTPIELNIKLFEALKNAETQEDKEIAILSLTSALLHEYLEDFSNDDIVYKREWSDDFEGMIDKSFGVRSAIIEIFGTEPYLDSESAKAAIELRKENGLKPDPSVLPKLLND